VDGFAIFRQIITAQEAVVPLETRNASSYFWLRQHAGCAEWQWERACASAILLVIRDDTGAQIISWNQPFAGATFFVLSLSSR